MGLVNLHTYYSCTQSIAINGECARCIFGDILPSIRGRQREPPKMATVWEYTYTSAPRVT